MLRYVQTQLGKSPLWSAIFKGHQKCVLLLIDAGANVNVQQAVSLSFYKHISVVEFPAHHVLVSVLCMLPQYV